MATGRMHAAGAIPEAEGSMQVSPVSHAIAIGLLVWLALRMRAVGAERGAVVAIVATLAGWMLASSWLAYRDLYRSLNPSMLLIVWATAAPIVLLGVLATRPRLRAALLAFAARTPLERLHRVHAVRVLAAGTIAKWWAGALPGHFILPVGIPDFVVGASALAAARLAASDPTRFRGLLIGWNALGAVVLLIAPPLIQLSQPGPLHWVTTGPTTDEVLGFPMSLVPTLIAPLFIALHLVAIARLRGSL